MLEKPAIPDAHIMACLEAEYGLQAAGLSFLTLGADVNTAVYRVAIEGDPGYFLKLRKGAFNEVAVLLPVFLLDQGIRSVITPLPNRAGDLWGSLDEYRLVLFPFIEGQDGYEVSLADDQWIQLGMALKLMHTIHVVASLAGLIPVESYSPRWREQVSSFQAQVELDTFADPTSARLAAFMRHKQREISHMVRRSAELGEELKRHPRHFVLCHGDLHPGNLHLTADGALYIVDWDDVIFAPQEHDLMFLGAGMGEKGPGDRETALFYQGYGDVEIDQSTLTYYRFERIVRDLVEFCKQVFLVDRGDEDREQAYSYFAGQFEPGREVEAAFRADRFTY